MAREVKPETALDRFVATIRDWYAEEPDPEKRWECLTPVMQELLADPSVLEASKNWPLTNGGGPRNPDGRVENLLFYQDPDYGFALQGVKKAADRSDRRGIHDHGRIYTLYGLLDGHEKVERFERIDDGSKEDYAAIRQTVEMAVGPGDVDVVKPYEIHTEVTVGEAAVALILRSEPSGSSTQHRYNMETGEYQASQGPRLVPVDMFGK
ncbi:MAG: hypothetical protein HW416_1492 [Chloroflexi bacterium]|nr:hypothetical protein [Chloroflexota bacterium]